VQWSLRNKSTYDPACHHSAPPQPLAANKGIASAAAYPYTGGSGTCKKGVPPSATISGFVDVLTNSETALMTAIAQQPVASFVEADQTCFQLYSSGVMDAPCGSQLDHTVLVVGYGTDNSKDYWNVKNSWGADWGMKGYIRLGRGSAFPKTGQCGIQVAPSYPTKA
jgi:KDEL-tailed cysteine endopeptidase